VLASDIWRLGLRSLVSGLWSLVSGLWVTLRTTWEEHPRHSPRWRDWPGVRTVSDLPSWVPGRCHRCTKRSGLLTPSAWRAVAAPGEGRGRNGGTFQGTRWRDELGAERVDLGLRLLARRVLVDLARERGVLLLLLPHLALFLKLPRRQGRGVSGAPSCIVWCTTCCTLRCTHALAMQDVMQGATLRVVNDGVHRAMHYAPAPPGSRCQSACCPCRPRSPATAYGAHAAYTHAVHMHTIGHPGGGGGRFGHLAPRGAGVGAREHDTARCGEARSSGPGSGEEHARGAAR